MCVRVSECVCVRERESVCVRERESVCVCVRERERERESLTEIDRLHPYPTKQVHVSL